MDDPILNKMFEEWRMIPFAPEYQASSHGRIIGKRGTILKPTVNYAMYLVLDLNAIQYRVNRVICHTFHGPPPSGIHHAAHKDNDRLNNYAHNLYWATPSENGLDLMKSNNIKGQANCVNVLIEEDVKFIRQLRSQGVSVSAIHRNHFSHLSRATISHAATGRTWRHVDA